MKVTECFVIHNMTFVSVDGKLPDRRKNVSFDGENHAILPAYDVGERVVIKGAYNLIGMDVSIT